MLRGQLCDLGLSQGLQRVKFLRGRGTQPGLLLVCCCQRLCQALDLLQLFILLHGPGTSGGVKIVARGFMQLAVLAAQYLLSQFRLHLHTQLLLACFYQFSLSPVTTRLQCGESLCGGQRPHV